MKNKGKNNLEVFAKNYISILLLLCVTQVIIKEKEKTKANANQE